MDSKYLLSALFLLSLCASISRAQEFRVAQTDVFTPQHKKILLLKDRRSHRKIILFQTNLRVNTDGTPLSYHPQDPRGRTLAINTVCNGFAVRRVGSRDNLCLKRATYDEAIGVFERFRDSNYQPVPGYEIRWQNVVAATKEDGREVPCIFKSGDFKGYFGSLTHLRNDITGDKGECEIKDQVDPLEVPALVLTGGEHAVKAFGANIGDLLIAYNPGTQLFTSAIIGDSGPPDNLGEGSVLLNMKLLGTTTLPKNKPETYDLSIEDTKVLIAIIPGSRHFNVAKPYTAENIEQRFNDWRTEAGFTTPEKLIELMKSFQPRLN
jgi:hypothetical protein